MDGGLGQESEERGGEAGRGASFAGMDQDATW